VPSDRIVGIDLGTSNSCIALHVQDKPEIIHNPQGDRTTPSVVGFADQDAVLVGLPAARQSILNPKRTVTGVKRLVGQRFDSEVVSSLREVLPYEVARARNGDAWVAIGELMLSPPELQAHILDLLRSTASAYCQSPVSRAVITVPAFFDETQRQAVRDAAEIAGLEAVRLLNEPTAVALAYGYGRAEPRRVVVVDLGGGTLDVTVMNVDRGRFEVLATDGDILLGGTDIDRALAVQFAREVEAQSGVAVGEDAVALQRLAVEAERAKKELTDRASVHISLPFLAQAASGPVDFERTIARDELEQMAQPFVARILVPCRSAVEMAGCSFAEIDEVILAGGMTRMPLVQREVEKLFGKRPSLRVNPDEAIAAGAAILSASLEGLLPEVTFVDVAPRSIGLRAAGDKYAPLIRRSTPLPAEATRAFATTQPNQRSFELQILQGEEEIASKNRRLANIVVEPIPLKPAGQVKLRVTFAVDAQGKLAVRAKEVGAEGETTVVVQPVSGLGRAEVQRHAAERRQQRGAVEREAASPVAIAPAGPSIEFGSPVANGGAAKQPAGLDRVPGVDLSFKSAPTPMRAPTPAPAPTPMRAPTPAPAPTPTPMRAPTPAPRTGGGTAADAGGGKTVYIALAIAVLGALAAAAYFLAG